MTLLLEAPSLSLILLAWRQVRRADRILFFRAHYLAEKTDSQFRKRWAMRLLRLLNRRAVLADLDEELAADLGYENNFDSHRFVEQAFEQVKTSPSYALLLSNLGYPPLERFYKIRLLPRVLRATQFLRTARHLLGSDPSLVILPSSLEADPFHPSFMPTERWRQAIPAAVRFTLACQEALSRFVRTLTLHNPGVLAAAGPLSILRQGWRAGIRRRTGPIQADVVHPMVFGIQQDGLFRGVRTGIDDTWLLQGTRKLSKIAFYFSHWKFSPRARRLQAERFRLLGIRCFDPARLPLTAQTIREQAAFCRALWRGILSSPRLLTEEGWITRISAALFHQYLQELHFCRSVSFKVSVELQDYSAAHVIRTVVANRLGRLTVGMHHAVPEGPYGLPGLRYVHINRYGVWGRAFERAYAGFWNPAQTVPVGAFRLDGILSARRPDRLEQLQSRYQERFGGVRPLIVVLFPTLGEYHLRGRLREFLEGLRLLRTLPGAFKVVCRFRSEALAHQYLRMGLKEVLQEDPRVVMDLAAFTTAEWMALSDGVIANSISSGMIEAACAGKPCFSFDTMKLSERVFARYGKDLILKNRNDLVRVVQNVSHSFRGWDCRWNELAQEYNYFSDGKNAQRFQRLILEAMGEDARPEPEPASQEVCFR